MISVHIAGVGMTQFGRSSNTLVEIMRAAAMSALALSKIQDFDAIYISVMNPENTPATLISLTCRRSARIQRNPGGESRKQHLRPARQRFMLRLTASPKSFRD